VHRRHKATPSAEAGEVQELKQLEEVNQRTPGLPTGAFPDLSDLAPRVDGKPLVVGPGSPSWETVVPTIRTLGYQKLSNKDFAPIVHAKLALLGDLWWHDEDALGHVADVIGFTPRRLWVSSANFTERSRSNLEFGYWTEVAALVDGAARFLLNLIAASEGVDPDADSFTPDFAAVDYDDEAFMDYCATWSSKNGTPDEVAPSVAPARRVRASLGADEKQNPA
jgi:hypothetical protein